MYIERRIKPRRAADATRIVLVALSRLIEWPQILTIVQPETLIRWHRKGSGCSGAGSHGYCVVSEPILGGLHHEYRLEPNAA